MFSFLESQAPVSKAYVSNGVLPRYVDPDQPPIKKKPFSTITKQHFNHTVQVVLPEELYKLIGQEVETKMSSLQYSRVIMPLSALLEGDFFNAYIKIGNILMLSEGRPGVADKYSLKDGTLRLDLAKETYERSGLLGKPMRDGGRKHVKTRYSVEIDLRQPSMLHGKKAFERIVWAFKNALNHSVTWLFYDFEEPSDATKERPISKHHPVALSCIFTQSTTKAVLLPDLEHTKSLATHQSFEDWALDTYEWLSLVGIGSPRILKEDHIDPFLSRYQVPDSDSRTSLNMVILTWTGFIPAKMIRALFVDISGRKELRKAEQIPNLFALSACSFKTEVVDQQEGYTILYLPSGQGKAQEDVNSTEAKALETSDRQGRSYALWEVQS